MNQETERLSDMAANAKPVTTTVAQRWMLCLLSFGMLLVLLIGLCLYQELSSLRAGRSTLNRRNELLLELNKCLAYVQSAETGQRGYVLTGKERYLQPHEEAVAAIPKQLAILKKLTVEDTVQTKSVERWSAQIDAKLLELNHVIALYRNAGQAEAIHAVNTDAGDILMKSVRDQFEQMEKHEHDLSVSENAALAVRRDLFNNTSVALAASALVLFGGFIYFMRVYVSVTKSSKRSEDLLKQSVVERSKELEAQAQLLNLTHDTILVRDIDGVVRFWNLGAQKSYGYTDDEAVGKTSHDLLKTEFPQSLDEINKELVENGRWEGELVHYARDGRRVVASSRWALKKNAEGKSLAVMEINSDVTARKQAEQSLLEALHDRSEERLRKVVEAAPSGIMLFDSAGKIALVNSQVEVLFGVERSELLEHSMETFLPELLTEINAIGSDNVASDANFKTFGIDQELLVKCKNGDNFPVEVGLSSLYNDGKFYFIASVVDVRARRLAESERAKLAAIVDSSQDAIISNSLDGIVRSWNRAAENVFGFTSDEMIGQPIGKIIPEDKLEEATNILSAIEHGRPTYQYESVRRRKDNSEIQVAITVSPIRDNTGRIIGTSKIVRDISDRIRSEEDLRRKVLELERSNDELKQFAYVCSHDLQEPLRVISNFNQLLAKRYKGKLDDKADEFIGFTVDAAKRMQNLINDLLTYSRVQTKEKTLRSVACVSAVRTAMANLKVTIDETNTKVDIADLPIVLGDQGQLVQLFQNLIANAIKFRSSAPPDIHIAAEQKGRDWIFRITDNGIGMDMQFADKIFVIFQRLHDREAYPGSGIGLAICKKIVQQHGGRMWVESEPGRGSTFLFSVPAELVNL